MFCGPAGTNKNKKLVHFAHAVVIAELLGYAKFLIKSMKDISGKGMNDIKKFNQDFFRDALPGKLFSETI